jgi:hypothetical protein
MQEQLPGISFVQWIRLKHLYLLLAGGVTVLQFFGFKWLYPYPNFLPDSFSYIETAIKGRNVNVWPIGYSWFLELFALVSRSHWWLTCCQYVLLQAAILYFVFSMGYLLQTSKWVFGGMLLISVVSPLVLHVSNFVSSDALFATLSLVWFTQLVWIACKPYNGVLLLHAAVLLMVFTVRYNAMYYPIISVTVVFFTRRRALWRWAGGALMLLLPLTFIGYTQMQYYKETGSALFSPFSGWQLASNALYAYTRVPAIERSEDQFAVVDLQRIVDRHIDSLQRVSYAPPLSQGIYYLWDPQSPLQRFPQVWWAGDSSTTGFRRWTLVAPIYKDYGLYVVSNYPKAFLHYYVWPNLVSYYVPPTEFLSSYNMGKDTIEQVGVSWFELKSNKIYSNTSDSVIRIISCYPLALALVNLFFVLGFAGLVLLKAFSESEFVVKTVCKCFLLIWICNMVFSVLASPVVLRYQIFPLLMAQVFVFWLLGHGVRSVMTVTMTATAASIKDKTLPI